MEAVQLVGEIRDACNSVARFLDALDRGGFLEIDLLRGAVLLELASVEEAANALTSYVADIHSAGAWDCIRTFRSLALSPCFGVDWLVVWDVARNKLPELRERISGKLNDPLCQGTPASLHFHSSSTLTIERKNVLFGPLQSVKA